MGFPSAAEETYVPFERRSCSPSVRCRRGEGGETVDQGLKNRRTLESFHRLTGYLGGFLFTGLLLASGRGWD